MEQAERDLFIGAAFLPVKLGASTLRFETAGVVAVAIAAALQVTSRQSNG
jgi:16S rRNA U1498 N3-methylase RsmE